MSTPAPRLRRLSASGRAALALYEVSGPEAAAWLSPRFTRPLPKLGGGRIALGELRDGDDLIDECLLVAPQGRPGYELSLHGAPTVCRRLEMALPAQSDPHDDAHLLASAFSDLPRPWLARRALAAPSRYVFSLLWHQACLPASEAPHGGEVTARQTLGVRKLWEPWRWVLFGAPNAGKSTLANALSGLARSNVTDAPGGTSDPVRHALCLDDIPVEVWDSAGEGDTDDPVIVAAQSLGAAHRARADGLIFAFDLAAVDRVQSRDLCEVAGSKPLLRLGLKADLAPAAAPVAVFRVSAHSGQGLDELCRALSAPVRRLLAGLPPDAAAPPMPAWQDLPALHFHEDEAPR